MKTDMQTSTPLVELKDATYWLGGREILSNITWMLRTAENWALIGPNGAGKTTLLRLIRGDIWPSAGPGSRIYYSNDKGRTSPIGFREKTGLVSAELLDKYKKMRWNLTGLDVVCTGFFGSAFLNQRPTDHQVDRARELMADLNIEEFAHQRILTMSLGQAKKILFARALVHSPRLVVLDEAFEGLDARSRERVSQVLVTLTETGVQILLASEREDDLMALVNRFLVLESGRIIDRGRIRQDDSRIASTCAARNHRPARVAKEDVAQKSAHRFLVRIENADVSLGGTRILSKINWTIRPGENWALLGPNGSGKTTLLSLIAGDLHPMPGGRIQRFGREDPKSLWEIRRRISLVSSDIQAEHQLSQTGLEAVMSGFFGSTGLYATPTKSQAESALSWLRRVGLEELAGREIQTLSYGNARMLLILRALVTDPELLLLDEPAAGLDAQAKTAVLALIGHLASARTAIIYVTHHAEEFMDAISHVALMDKGTLTLSSVPGASERCFGGHTELP